MSPGALRIAVLGLLTAALSSGDTVTTLDHLSVNGILTKMSDGNITLEARYGSGPKTLTIPMTKVESIDFNSIAFNPGAPPKAYGLGPGDAAPALAAPKQALITDAVELRGGGGERAPCKVVSIDESMVHCEASGGQNKGKTTQYPRTIVLRIVVRGIR